MSPTSTPCFLETPPQAGSSSATRQAAGPTFQAATERRFRLLWSNDAGFFAIGLQLKLQPHSPVSPLRATLAGVLCLLVLLCGTLAASAVGHRWVHAQTAHDSEVGCAIDLFASGGVAAPTAAALIVAAFAGRLLACRLPVSAELPSFNGRACSTRGPPVLG